MSGSKVSEYVRAVSNFQPFDQEVGSFVAVFFSDANITFRSIDGVLFTVHKKMLIRCGPGLLEDIESRIDSERRINLPEISSVLELLFQYVYPNFCPSLDVAFDVVEALGNAGEKYGVVYAIIGCCSFMR